MANLTFGGAVIGLARNKENTLLTVHDKIKDVEYAIRVIEKLPGNKPIKIQLYDMIYWDGIWAYVDPAGENKGIIEPIKIPKIENKVLENVRY
jgi:hypothetical protein